jgi:hypothetical protein
MWGTLTGPIVHQRNACMDILEDLAPFSYHDDNIHMRINPQWKPQLTFHFPRTQDRLFQDITNRGISYSPIQLFHFYGVVYNCSGNVEHNEQPIEFKIAFRVIHPTGLGKEADCQVERFYSSEKFWNFGVRRIRLTTGKTIVTTTKYGSWNVRCSEIPAYIPYTLVRRELPVSWGRRRREPAPLTLDTVGSKRTYICTAARDWLIHLYEMIRATMRLPTVIFYQVLDYCIEVNLDSFWIEFTGTREDIIKSLHNQSNFYEIMQVLYYLILRGHDFPSIYALFLDHGPMYLQLIFNIK